jgi:hypothetical protein
MHQLNKTNKIIILILIFLTNLFLKLFFDPSLWSIVILWSIVLLIIFIFRQSKKAELKKIFLSGKIAKAVIIKSNIYKISSKTYSFLSLELQVLPENAPSFFSSLKVKTLQHELGGFAEQRRIAVMIHPEIPQQVILLTPLLYSTADENVKIQFNFEDHIIEIAKTDLRLQLFGKFLFRDVLSARDTQIRINNNPLCEFDFKIEDDITSHAHEIIKQTEFSRLINTEGNVIVKNDKNDNPKPWYIKIDRQNKSVCAIEKNLPGTEYSIVWIIIVMVVGLFVILFVNNAIDEIMSQ